MTSKASIGRKTVAVIGGGPSGLSMLKTLREDGFLVTLFERRDGVGGLWTYTDDTSVTTALPWTVANGSKYSCGFSDFPVPEKYDTYLTGEQFTDYFRLYAQHFDLNKDIVLNTIVSRVVRNQDDSKWQIELETSGKFEVKLFDKVAFAHGYQNKPNRPTFEGEEAFKGTVLYSQKYRTFEEYKNKRVVIVGIGSSTADIVTDLIPHASNVYISHRRGMIIGSRWRNGAPGDLAISWQRRQTAGFMTEHLPNLSRKIADITIAYLMRKQWGGLDPSWRLQPAPSISHALPTASETLIPLLREGKVKSLHGIRRFRGLNSIEFLDGTVLNDIDSVICATGYTADFSLAPFVEESHLLNPSSRQNEQVKRLYQNMFPPKYADSIVFLNYSAFGKSNGIGFTDVISMAVSNIWRGISSLPPIEKMEAQISEHHAWMIEQWKTDKYINSSMVNRPQWQKFLHETAGTGMENLGWGWKGWKFWWSDRKMSKLMCHGVETSHAFRYFETGKRPTWSGARQAIIDVNESVKIFPLINEK